MRSSIVRRSNLHIIRRRKDYRYFIWNKIVACGKSNMSEICSGNIAGRICYCWIKRDKISIIVYRLYRRVWGKNIIWSLPRCTCRPHYSCGTSSPSRTGGTGNTSGSGNTLYTLYTLNSLNPLWACRSSRAVYLCTTLDFPLCWVGKPLDCLALNHLDNVVVILNVINNSLVLVGKIEVNRYFPVLMHPNRFYEFNHNPAVKALNVFVFQKGG